MQKTFFNFLRKVGKAVSGKGLAKLPFAVPLYQFFYHRLKPKGIVTAQSYGHKMLVNANDTGMAPYLIMHGWYDKGQTDFFKHILKPGMVFIDIGANIGYFSLIAASIVGSAGKVVAFEPDDEHFDLLRRNIENNNYKNITPIKMAVSDTTGVVEFYRNPVNLCAHSLIESEGYSMVKVAATTLDDFFHDERIDVIKIDVEGAEPIALRGMRGVIRNNKNLILVSEFFPEGLSRSGYKPEQYLQDLHNLGFSLFQIVDDPGEDPKPILPERFSAISRGEGINKLANIVCVRQ